MTKWTLPPTGGGLFGSSKTIVIPDDELIHIWKSPETKQIAEVTPDWYEENGTPIDNNGNDMTYLRTEWRKKK